MAVHLVAASSLVEVVVLVGVVVPLGVVVGAYTLLVVEAFATAAELGHIASHGTHWAASSHAQVEQDTQQFDDPTSCSGGTACPPPPPHRLIPPTNSTSVFCDAAFPLVTSASCDRTSGWISCLIKAPWHSPRLEKTHYRFGRQNRLPGQASRRPYQL